MKRSPFLPASAGIVLAVVAIGGGCNFGQSGIAPPTNRIFLPAGIAADPEGDFLYVVNSNSDLRFNAGTVVAVPALKPSDVVAIRALPTTMRCAKTRFSRTESVADTYCCVDMIDSNVINCNEPQFVQSDATVQIGSFGGAIQIQSYLRDPSVPNSELVRRLFVAVRAEPSITYVDATVVQTDLTDRNSRKVSMRCTGLSKQDGSVQPIHPFCDDNWKVRRRSGDTPGSLDVPEEPHLLAYDDDLKALYVGHLTVVANSQVQGGGVSTIDVCNPQSESSVRFAGLARTTFLPESLTQAVAALSPGDPGAPGTRVYATARYSTAISGLVLRPQLDATCGNPLRDLTLVPAESFFSSAFSPRGADIRGILFSADRTEAFVLHRNDADTPTNPAAITVIDRRPLADGTPANAPMDILEVCGGPTAMQMHDAGRGNRIYVTCYDVGQIYVVDPNAVAVTSTIEVGAGPISLVFSPMDPSVGYVASFANSHLSVLDLEPGSPTENHVVMRIGLPHGYGE
jgi:YVTN family beta-propeller protein